MMTVNKVVMILICVMFFHAPMAFSMNEVPGAASLIAPVDTEESRPVFKWSEENNATWYQLFLRDRSTGEEFVQWYEIEDHLSQYPQVACIDNLCTAILDSDLADSTYDWWVLSWNNTGSQWSGPKTFKVQTNDALPSKVTLLSPSGVTGSIPVLKWHKDYHATWYKLYLTDAGGSYKFVQWYEMGSNDFRYPEVGCSGSECTITPETSLDPGVYTWWIKGWNENGSAPWSKAMSFTVTSDDSNLKEFESTQELSAFLKHAMENSTTGNKYQWMLETVEAMTDNMGATYSKTNVQVGGVDELDTVKFDGQYLFVAPVQNGYPSPEKFNGIKIFELSPLETLEKGRISLEDHEKNVDGFYLVPGTEENASDLLITLGGKASQMLHGISSMYGRAVPVVCINNGTPRRRLPPGQIVL